MAHPNLAWSASCSTLLGASGLVQEVDPLDGTAKLQAHLRLSDGSLASVKFTQWLPLRALLELPEPGASELRAALAAFRQQLEAGGPEGRESDPTPARSQEDQEWSLASGHPLPLDVVVVRLDGTEFARSVESLSHRFEVFRRSVAAYVQKDESQVDLLLGEMALPKNGTFRQISDLLVPGMRLQLLLRRRKLHPGAAKRLAKELRDYEREASNIVIEPVEDPDFDGPSDRWVAVKIRVPLWIPRL